MISISGFTRLAQVAGVGFLLAAAVPAVASADAGFRKWINGFYSTAAKHGISRRTYDSVFAGINSPDPEVLEKARYQPEFTAKIWDYLDSRVTSEKIATGKQMRRKYKRWLNVIERKYGVDRDILLAIWAIESIYGEYLTRPGVLHHTGRALATLAYADRKRSKYARQQLTAALKIVQNGDVSAKGLKGSWAGAMGHTQFIPTSYQAWAVDIDGDGKRDVWNSPPDALASAANLLKRNGWVAGKTWGYEVVLPKGFNTRLERDNGYKIRDFAKMGVRRPGGRPFPRNSDNAVLRLPAGAKGPAFLMLRNFYVLKKYNNADKYALAVGHLADRLAGGGPIAQPWPRGYTPLTETERREVQKHLSRAGIYDGKIDGNIGSGSRKAILKWQKRNGMKADGFPSRKLLARMRSG